MAARGAGLCDVYPLTIRLPKGTFQKPGDGVFIDIRWSTDFNQWNLFVYDPAGRMVASGYELDSNSQAVLLDRPANGTYQVVAVPFYHETTMRYRGEARVLLNQNARSTRDAKLLLGRHA